MTSQQLVLIAVVVLLTFGVWAYLRLGKRADGAPSAAKPASIELLCIDLDTATDQLHLSLAGRPLATVEEIRNPVLRAQVEGLMRLLTPEKKQAAPSSPSPAEASLAPADAAASAVPLLDDDLNAPLWVRLRESLGKPRDYAPVKPIEIPKAQQSDKEQTAEPSAALIMFKEINGILQRKLREQRDVPLVDLVGAGETLYIEMGGQRYQRVEDVPDERARALIREAIAEWEAK